MIGRAAALLAIAIPASFGSSTLPPSSIEKCAKMAAEERGEGYAAAACEIVEEQRLSKPEAELTAEEAIWVAQHRVQQKERDARRTLLNAILLLCLVASALTGVVLAWRVGPGSDRAKARWIIIGAYLIISFVIAGAAGSFLEGSEGNAFTDSAVLHLHWGSLLYGIAIRRKIRHVVTSGWGRLFLTVWTLWVVWCGYELHESWGDHYAGLRFTGLGFFAPAMVMLAVQWVRQGFLRESRSTASAGESSTVADADVRTRDIGPTFVDGQAKGHSRAALFSRRTSLAIRAAGVIAILVGVGLLIGFARDIGHAIRLLGGSSMGRRPSNWDS
jgi:hypothetical protein